MIEEQTAVEIAQQIHFEAMTAFAHSERGTVIGQLLVLRVATLTASDLERDTIVRHFQRCADGSEMRGDSGIGKRPFAGEELRVQPFAVAVDGIGKLGDVAIIEAIGLQLFTPRPAREMPRILAQAISEGGGLSADVVIAQICLNRLSRS